MFAGESVEGFVPGISDESVLHDLLTIDAGSARHAV